MSAAALSAAEAALLGCAAAAVLWRLLDGAVFGAAAAGLALAWAASSLSTAALAATKSAGGRAFWWALGGGIALRAAVLLAMIGWAWKEPSQVQAGGWSAYALGVLLFLQVEYRRIIRD